jgi:hypothetical protein
MPLNFFSGFFGIKLQKVSRFFQASGEVILSNGFRLATRLASNFVIDAAATGTWRVYRLATAPMRRSHSSRFPRKPSSQAILKLNRAIISRRFPLFVSLTLR